MLNVVILADGDFPTSPEPLKILSEASFVCCCDGAAEKLIAFGRIPDAIVGDGDSLSPEFKAQYKDILHTESEQEYNDLTKATRFVVSHFATPECRAKISEPPHPITARKSSHYKNKKKLPKLNFPSRWNLPPLRGTRGGLKTKTI